jgi:hypothetical protein
VEKTKRGGAEARRKTRRGGRKRRVETEEGGFVVLGVAEEVEGRRCTRRG